MYKYEPELSTNIEISRQNKKIIFSVLTKKRCVKNRSPEQLPHRMYITKLADKIILLQEGNLIEEGSFEELIKQKKEFYSMYKIQSDSYSIPID